MSIFYSFNGEIKTHLHEFKDNNIVDKKMSCSILILLFHTWRYRVHHEKFSQFNGDDRESNIDA